MVTESGSMSNPKFFNQSFPQIFFFFSSSRTESGNIVLLDNDRSLVGSEATGFWSVNQTRSTVARRGSAGIFDWIKRSRATGTAAGMLIWLGRCPRRAGLRPGFAGRRGVTSPGRGRSPVLGYHERHRREWRTSRRCRLDPYLPLDSCVQPRPRPGPRRGAARPSPRETGLTLGNPVSLVLVMLMQPTASSCPSCGLLSRTLTASR